MIEQLRTGIEQITEELLDEMETKADPDIMRDFAAPLPFIVISELLGIPKRTAPNFKCGQTQWSTRQKADKMRPTRLSKNLNNI